MRSIGFGCTRTFLKGMNASEELKGHKALVNLKSRVLTGIKLHERFKLKRLLSELTRSHVPRHWLYQLVGCCEYCTQVPAWIYAARINIISELVCTMKWAFLFVRMRKPIMRRRTPTFSTKPLDEIELPNVIDIVGVANASSRYVVACRRNYSGSSCGASLVK